MMVWQSFRAFPLVILPGEINRHRREGDFQAFYRSTPVTPNPDFAGRELPPTWLSGSRSCSRRRDLAFGHAGQPHALVAAFASRQIDRVIAQRIHAVPMEIESGIKR
jgi:hypothetical protein